MMTTPCCYFTLQRMCVLNSLAQDSLWKGENYIWGVSGHKKQQHTNPIALYAAQA